MQYVILDLSAFKTSMLWRMLEINVNNIDDMTIKPEGLKGRKSGRRKEEEIRWNSDIR